MSKHLIAALIGLLPVAGSAQTFSVPDGCEGVVTVQQKGCLLVNIWQCSADPEGDKWIGLFSEAGLYSVQHVDREFQWLEAFKMSGSEALVQPADDPASMTELLENGLDTYEFVIDKESGAERTVGFDTLTHFKTVHAWHHDVQKNDVAVIFAGNFKSFEPTGCSQHLKVLRFQAGLEKFDVVVEPARVGGVVVRGVREHLGLSLRGVLHRYAPY